jgi:hypothetical protein
MQTKPGSSGFLILQNVLTTKINKYTIETMMNSALLHKAFISQPECGLVAYWGMVTRDISNRGPGDYRT